MKFLARVALITTGLWALGLCILGVEYLSLLRQAHAQGSVVFSTQGDVSMTGSAVALGSGNARYVDVIALAANSAAVRCANSTVSSSRGVPIAAGGAYRFGPLNNPSLVVDLSAIYCVGTNGDKVATIMGAN